MRVGLIRVLRLWNVYDPVEQARLETAVGRPFWVSNLSLWSFYLLVPLAALGAVVLRHRRLLLFPFVAVVLLSTVTAFLSYGDARFRVEADVALAMLAGVALDALWRHHEYLSRHVAAEAVPEPLPEPALLAGEGMSHEPD